MSRCEPGQSATRRTFACVGETRRAVGCTWVIWQHVTPAMMVAAYRLRVAVSNGIALLDERHVTNTCMFPPAEQQPSSSAGPERYRYDRRRPRQHKREQDRTDQ